MFIVGFEDVLAQDVDVSTIINPEFKKGRKKELLTIQFSKLARNVDYNIIYKMGFAIVEIGSPLHKYRSIVIADLESGDIIKTFNYVYQLVEINDPNFILVQLLSPENIDVLGLERLNVQLEKPADIKISNYINKIALINISNGESEVLIKENQKLSDRPVHKNEEESEYLKKYLNDYNKDIYVDYISELNTFAYRKQDLIGLYSLDTKDHKTISIGDKDPEYFGNVYNLGSIVIADKEQRKDLYAYDIYLEELYHIGKDVTEFDVNYNYEDSAEDHQNYVVMPLYNDKAFMFVTRDEDSNKNGTYDKYDNSKLFITFLGERTKHLVDEGPVTNVKYYPESGYVSYEMLEDFTRNPSKNEKMHARKIYLYDVQNKQRVLLTNNGETCSLIDDFGMFIFYSYDTDTNLDGVRNSNDIPTTKVFSIIFKKIKTLSDGKLTNYNINGNSMLYTIDDKNNDTSTYVYDYKSKVKKLLAKDSVVEINMPDSGKILLRRQQKDQSQSEMMLYDVNTKSLIYMGRNYIQLKEVNRSEMIASNNFAEFLEKNSSIVMVQQGSIINDRGMEELTDYYNLVVYNTKRNSKNMIFQGDIHDLGYTKDQGYIVVTVRVRGELNYKTVVVNSENLSVTEIEKLSMLIGCVGDKERYLVMQASDSNDELVIYDTTTKEYYIVMDNLSPIRFPEDNFITYSVGNYLIFNIKEGKHLHSMYYLKPNSLLIRIGKFNNNYIIEENLDYVALVNYIFDGNAVEIKIYSL